MNLEAIILLSSCYILGAIPFSVIIGKVFFGIDVREHGSGNPGATNTLRTLGTQAGILVLMLDIFKGMLAVILGRMVTSFYNCTHAELEAISGGLAILGHITSPFLNMKGGKGVATFTGVILMVHPLIGLLTIGVFLTILIFTKFVSLASITAAATYPLFIYFRDRSDYQVVNAFAITFAIVIIYKHRQNIKRLISGDENKFKTPQKKSR